MLRDAPGGYAAPAGRAASRPRCAWRYASTRARDGGVCLGMCVRGCGRRGRKRYRGGHLPALPAAIPSRRGCDLGEAEPAAPPPRPSTLPAHLGRQLSAVGEPAQASRCAPLRGSAAPAGHFPPVSPRSPVTCPQLPGRADTDRRRCPPRARPSASAHTPRWQPRRVKGCER